MEALYNGRNGIEKGALDLDNSLCLAEGQSVWRLSLDCVVISDDGSLLDCLSLACRSCLTDVRMPTFKVLEQNEVGPQGPEITVQEDPNDYWHLRCERVPIFVSIGVVSADWVFDLSKNEEACCSSRLSFGVTKEGKIVNVATSGETTSVSYTKAMGNILEAAVLAGKTLLGAFPVKGEEKTFHIGK